MSDSARLARLIDEVRPREVYNLGGSRHSNCSMLEAISLCEEISGRKLNWSYVADNRNGDHIWYISSLKRFRTDYPNFRLHYSLQKLLQDIYDQNAERWSADKESPNQRVKE